MLYLVKEPFDLRGRPVRPGEYVELTDREAKEHRGMVRRTTQARVRHTS